ncbi:formate dehydrogenase accessory protein FdhE [Caviibacterium pharyngocola]|uniref:Protein FdhE homolog n=1 Tax=Caviibacterium pharyngocola TaxID=28159 RepID=A0A2M8RYR7_9PAST|nr:formate dehydrogenase accessory protein FdhE [Caviibacterium pharyngocola]PJG84022.1 formate dehydrogenase accessory protein FdhE [Caviibacterium pharyngocola]
MSIKILPENEIQQAASSFHNPPLLFANPKNLYQRRIKRLTDLAQNHPMQDYLLFAADIAQAQLDLLENTPLGKIEHLTTISTTAQTTPLDYARWQRDDYWLTALNALLAQIKTNENLNESLLTTIDWLEKASQAELNHLADKLLAQDFSAVESDKAVFIWAALSLYWLQLAQQIPHNAKMESGENLHLCPVCGSAPTASVVHFGATQGLRYLHCSLCESEWNMVRSKCSNCDQSGKLDYWSLDSEFAPVKAESCGDCHSYLKVMYQEKDPHVEPIADDLASVFLDVEMEEKGFARSGINPFVFPAE